MIFRIQRWFLRSGMLRGLLGHLRRPLAITAAFAGTAMVLALGGCQGGGPIDKQVQIEQNFWNRRFVRPTTMPASSEPRVGATAIANHGLLPEISGYPGSGHYAFTLPPDVTSFKKVSSRGTEYLLYAGAPPGGATPFITMIVSPHLPRFTQNNPAFVISSEKHFVLNNLEAHQISGYHDGHPFTELILTRFDSANEIDALAIVKNRHERHEALKILATIHWKK